MANEKPSKKKIPPKVANVELDDEMKEIFSKMRKMRDDLEAKMLDVYESKAINQDILNQYLKEEKEPPPGIKKKTDQQLTELKNQVQKILGKKADMGVEKVKDKKKSSSRKKKFIGKRQNWLEM